MWPTYSLGYSDAAADFLKTGAAICTSPQLTLQPKSESSKWTPAAAGPLLAHWTHALESGQPSHFRPPLSSGRDGTKLHTSSEFC